jgi:dipeptidyl aminopeptidase/acylaminoacyl peptidase
MGVSLRTFAPAVLVLSVCLSISTLEAATNRIQTPLSAEEVAGLRTYGESPIALSPDGEWLAYTVKDANVAGLIEKSACAWETSCKDTDVWLTNTRNGHTRSLTQKKGNNWGPAWSPDGGKLAFFSNRDGRVRLWMWNRQSNRLERISLELVQVNGTREAPVWLRDGRQLIVRVAPKERTRTLASGPHRSAHSEDSPRVLLGRSPQTQEPSLQEPGVPLSDLAKVSVSDGRVVRILNDVGLGAYKISPDGRWLAVASEGSHLPNKFMFRWQLASVPINGGRKQVLVDDIEQEQPIGTWFSWSPDSSQIAYTDIGSQDYKNVGKTRAELSVVSLRDGSRWTSKGSRHPNFGDNERPPLWSRNGNAIYLLAEGALWRVGVADRRVEELANIPGKSIIEIVSSRAEGTYSSRDNGKSMMVLTRDLNSMAEGFYRVVLSSGESAMLHEANESFGNFPGSTTASTADGTVISYLAERCDRYPNLWVADGTLHSPKQITHVNPELDQRKLGASRSIQWRSSDGDLLQGALLLPVNYEPGTKYPVIVDVYGGISPLRALNHFDIGVDMSPDGIGQFLATRGYAVFRPESRLGLGTPMRDIAAAVLSGVDKLIQIGLADPQRLGIMGHSYGGYSVMSVLVQSKQFAAALMGAGHGNMISRCYRLSKTLEGNSMIIYCEDAQGRIGATLWQDRDRYISNSPIFFLDKVTTPLLILQGARDENTPAYTAEEVFAGLQGLGRTAEYVKYLDEGHTFKLYRDKVDMLRRIDRWFGRLLLSRNQAPSGDDLGGTKALQRE